MSDTINKLNFWNLNKDYYLEADNSGADFYNSYSDFTKKSKTDTNLKKFKYNNPFKFIPSYGSSMSIAFLNNIDNFGDFYLMLEEDGFNRIALNLSLRFESRGDKEAKDILNYIDNKTQGKENYFPVQYNDSTNLTSENLYKSLYSLKPYVVQEFKCEDSNSTSTYLDNNSISLTLNNDLMSRLTSRNIIYAESLPEKEKQLIKSYWRKDKLDIQPIYPLNKGESFNEESIRLGSSKPYKVLNKINPKFYSFEMEFKSIDDETLLKLLSFFISKNGMETFEFDLREPEAKTINLMCSKLQHDFLYMNSHTLKATVAEVPVPFKYY